MQHITLHKQPGESYTRHTFKVYEARRNGEVVGTVAQNLWNKWEVVDVNFNRVSHHTTIKAAVRVAGRVL
jgi:ABC-type tungstate transport system permease subunit